MAGHTTDDRQFHAQQHGEEEMRKRIAATLLAGVGAFAVVAGAQGTAQQGTTTTITATVVDLSCKIVNNASGPDHIMCAQVCADKGQPLGLLGSDDTFYVPVNAGMGIDGENKRLRPLAEQKVTVTGRVIKRAGMNAIVIDRIAKAS
jgi:hypothetical protein